MMALKLAFSLILILHLVNGDIVIQTESGPIRGKNVGKVDAFLGIPYAEPPLGQLRFAKPKPKNPWSQIYDATKLPPPCIQMDLNRTRFSPDVSNMSEDCLYLNIWMPVKRNQDELKAVMLFIHGGGFVMGSTSMELYNGARLAEYGDVAVVTINYRIGALGFFTGFTDDAPGSQGLYDQVLAIQWIKDNVKNFNGNPDNIVLFGESAGALSISMHQISPLSKNLFKRAILQSGSSLSLGYLEENKLIRDASAFYASFLGCTKEGDNWFVNASDTINCLRRIPAGEFSEVDIELIRNGSGLLIPRIGNDFLPNNIIDSFKNGQFKNSEVLMGITRDEGTLFLAVSQPELFRDIVLGEAFNKTEAYYTIKRWLGNNDSVEDEKIVESYLDDVTDQKSYLNVVANAIGDILINCGNIFQAEYQSWRENPVYFYMFDYRSPNSTFPDWIGVPHFTEVPYVFGNPLFGAFTEEEEQLSRDIINMWSTFAKTGNPTIPGRSEWPRYSYEDPKYLIIGKRDTIGTRPDNNRCERLRNRFRATIDESVIQALKKNNEQA